MTIIGIILIAAGAIIRFGVTTAVEGANLDIIGLVLMGAGVLALIAGLLSSDRFSRSQTRVRVEEGPDGRE